MAKKKPQKVLSSVNPLVEFEYEDPLFSFAAHPSKPLIVSGLATGHVYMHKYNDKLLQEKLEEKIEIAREQSEEAKPKKLWNLVKAEEPEDKDLVSIVWKTKRHKSSCRTVLMDPLNGGESIYTFGKDKVVKKAHTETGKVDFKKSFEELDVNFSTAIHSSAHPHLIIGDESGGIRVLDSRNKFKQIFELKNVHDDMVNQIISVPGGSQYHYISVGSTTVAKIDLRKGVLLQSENQEDEVLSAAFPNPESNQSLLCGMGLGVVTLWKEKKNDYMDQLSRIKLSKDNSIESIVSTMKEDEKDACWAGCADGIVYKLDSKKSSILETRIHDLGDEIAMLDIDYNYRLISGGMSSLKIWGDENDNKENILLDDDAYEKEGEIGEDDDDEESSLESDSGSEVFEGESASEESSDQDSDEEKEPVEEKKLPADTRKTSKRKIPLSDSTNKKLKPQTLHKAQDLHANGIKKFDDL